MQVNYQQAEKRTEQSAIETPALADGGRRTFAPGPLPTIITGNPSKGTHPPGLPTVVNGPVEAGEVAPAPAPHPATPAPAQQVIDLMPPEAVSSAMNGTPVPAVPILRMVNSKRITLNFELRDAHPGMTGVDLWSTRDMRTWKRMEAVRASASAYEIKVTDEGLYGFTMIARSSTSPAGTPRSGDLPRSG